jgi:hypothetical protein
MRLSCIQIAFFQDGSQPLSSPSILLGIERKKKYRSLSELDTVSLELRFHRFIL